MTGTALATVDDAASYGYTLPADPQGSALLLRASARIRGAVTCPIEQTTSTVRLEARGITGGTVLELPAVPVTDVSSVQRVAEDGTLETVPHWHWHSGQAVKVGWRGLFEVVFTHGYAVIPDALTELTCAVAARYADVPKGAAGLRSKTVGSVSWTVDGVTSAMDLTAGELAQLARIVPVRRAWSVRAVLP